MNTEKKKKTKTTKWIIQPRLMEADSSVCPNM